MTTLKIFLPHDSFNTEHTSAEYICRDVEENDQTVSVYISNVTSAVVIDRTEYFVISLSKLSSSTNHHANVLIDRRQTSTTTWESIQNIHIILYNLSVFTSLANNVDLSSNYEQPGNSTVQLLHSLRKCNANQKSPSQKSSKFLSAINVRWSTIVLPDFIRCCTNALHPFVNLFTESAIHGHFTLWLQCIKTYSFQR